MKVIEPGPERIRIIPENYLSRGTIRVRFYLDSNCQFFHSAMLHQFNDLVVPCKGRGTCEICDAAQLWKRRTPNDNIFWKFRATKKSFCYAFVFSATHVPSPLSCGKPSILLGTLTLKKKLKQLVSTMPLEDLKRFFDPLCKNHILTIRKERRSIEIDRAKQKAVCEPLPEWYPPLAQLYDIETDTLYRDWVRDFIAKIKSEYKKYDISIRSH